MVDKLNLKLISTGLEESLPCDYTLINRGLANNIVFNNEKIHFEICLKDVVDIGDFHDLLVGKEKKIVLHSTLKYKNKEYLGLRKYLSKNGKIAVSLGGYRLEFEEESKKIMMAFIKALKLKLS